MKEKDKKLSKSEREDKEQALIEAGLTGAAAEVVQRYGSANKEHLVALGGVDNETGKTQNLSLKRISKWKGKDNPKNVKAQGGKTAEVKEAARRNANARINGEKTRTVRTGDIPKQQYGEGNKLGNTIGSESDQIHDMVDVDSTGKPIVGTSYQMKFEGKTPDEALNKLLDKDHQKYFDNNEKIAVPSDFYEGIKKSAEKRIKEVEKQIDTIKKQKSYDNALLAKKQQELEKLKSIRDGKSIKKSLVSNKDAQLATKNAELSTALDIAKISHKAGLKQAKSGAVIGGSISIIKNLVSIIKDEKEPEKALLDVAKDTGSAVAISYGTGFTGSALKGAMQNSGEKFVRSLSKTNLPAMLVTVTLETGKTFAKYFKGEIDGVQCLEELGEKGTGLVSSALFSGIVAAGAKSVFGPSAAIGQILIPIPVIGGLIGGMLGYALSSACYGQLLTALKDAKMARERRIQIEAECAQAIFMIQEYRTEIETAVSEYLSDHIITFHTAFDEIKRALNIGDIDGFIAGANIITGKLGGKPQFDNISGFETLMKSPENLIL